MSNGTYSSEDINMNEDSRHLRNGINFESWLQLFVQMQQQHRAHCKSQKLSNSSSISSKKTKEVQNYEEAKVALMVTSNRPSSRLSRKPL
ncbi:hypothetical protein HanOQP8_Chr17g0678991 [Helianthus annuus]|nr:hypothetical protein HanOQP8_Chr17g0678991 [Helianthus annuus]